MFLDASELIVIVAASGAGLAGMYVERGRAALFRAERRRPKLAKAPRRAGKPAPFRRDGRPYAAPLDAAEQLRLVMDAEFSAQRLLNRGEAKVFEAAEAAIREQRLAWRVMAQVGLGEILSSSDEAAFRAIHAKRVDVLVVGPEGLPLAALEHQGDPVTREALRKAGVRYVELADGIRSEDVAREIARLAGAARADVAREGARRPRGMFT